MKHWWRSWAVIDLLGLGGGLALTLGFVFYRSLDGGGSSAWVDLWPNLSTEIVGAWISVRLIDALIRRRERWHGIRQTLAGNLLFMASIARQLPPEFYEWRAQELRNELHWFQERLPGRTRSLSVDEREDVQRAVSKGQLISVAVDQYLELRQQADDARAELDLAAREIDAERAEVLGLADQLRIIGQDSEDAPASQFREAVKSSRGVFTGHELQFLEAADVPDLKMTAIDAHFYLHQLEWLNKVEVEYGKFRDRPKYEPSPLLDHIEKASMLLDNAMPLSLVSKTRACLEALREMASIRSDIHRSLSDLESLVEKVRSNIFEESEPE